MIQIQIDKQNNALADLSKQLSDKELRVASTRSINLSLRKANTQYRREITRNYAVKYGDTRDIVIPKRASYYRLEGMILGEERPLSLSRFNPRFSKKKGVSIQIKRSQRMRLPYAFIVQNSSKRSIFGQVWARGKYSGGQFRRNKSRYPITPLKTASPFGMMKNDSITRNINSAASSDMTKEFERQVKLLLSRRKSK